MRPRDLIVWACLLAGCRSTPIPEALLGEDVELVFEGNVQYQHSTLLKAALVEVGDLPTDQALRKARVDDAAYSIEAFYRDKGFPFALVEYEFEELPEGHRVLFRITEGPRAVLADVELTGTLEFDEEELARFFEPARGFLSRSGYYVDSRVTAGERELEAFYHRSGYLRASVRPHEVRFSEDGTQATIAVAVDPGVRFRLRSSELVGDLSAAPEALEKLRQQRIDRPYTPHLGFRLRSRIIGIYQENGYPDCRVELEQTLDEASGDVRLRFTIEPGQRVRLRDVRVEGLDGVDFELFKRRLDVKPGQVYDTSKVQQSLRDLYLTGLFRTAEAGLEGEGEERDLVFRITELPTLEFYVEPGYGSYEGPRVVFGVTHKDFLSTGKKLRLESNVSALDQGVSVNLYDPFVGRNLALTTTLSADRRIEPAFTSLDYGARANLTRTWTRDFSTTLGYELKRSFLEDIDPDAEGTEDQEAINLGTATIAARWDQTDSLFFPTRGTRARVNFDYAARPLGSTVDFVKGQVDLLGYVDVGWDVTTVLAWRTGIAVPVGIDDEIPIQERFFLGGENTVRSFKQDELGVGDGVTGGGEASNVVNVELRRRIAGNISGALFYDLGAIQEDYQDWGFDNLGQGLGFGVRYMLPIGPVRVDTAWNPDPNQGDDDWVVHLSVGMPF